MLAIDRQRAEDYTWGAECDGWHLRVGAREGVHVPAGAPHRVVSESSGDLWMLVVSEPPSHGDRVIAEMR